MDEILGCTHNGSGFSSSHEILSVLDYLKLEMNNMATTISGLKVNSQMFKCFNCGHKTVSLGYSMLTDTVKPANVEEDDLDVSVVTEKLEILEGLQEDWMATCSNCGWSDN